MLRASMSLNGVCRAGRDLAWRMCAPNRDSGRAPVAGVFAETHAPVAFGESTRRTRRDETNAGAAIAPICAKPYVPVQFKRARVAFGCRHERTVTL